MEKAYVGNACCLVHLCNLFTHSIHDFFNVTFILSQNTYGTKFSWSTACKNPVIPAGSIWVIMYVDWFPTGPGTHLTLVLRGLGDRDNF